MDEFLASAAARASGYLGEVSSRAVAPTPEALDGLERLDEPLPAASCDPMTTIALLDEVGSPATMATAGGRYYGFVVGAALPVTVAASWLAAAWNQNAGLAVISPVAAKLEEVALRWLLELLHLPSSSAVGFVTGATQASFTCLAAARHSLLERQGWNVESAGLVGAPPLRVVVSEEVHVAVLKALSLLGLGSDRVVRVPTDDQGRMRPGDLPPLDTSTIVCLQAGNVNTGAFDPASAILAAAKAAGSWVHVDGAFGLWVAASPEHAHLVSDYHRADSWATDGHKWLNVPYDSGMAIVRDAASLRAAMTISAPYLVWGESREPQQYTPDMSHRARAVEVWAALRTMGRQGVGELIAATCRHASRFASGLRAAGYQILNDVVVNQVLVSFGDPETTRQVVAAIQADGTCWAAATVWQGKTAMRLSVSSWATTDEDVTRSLDAILRVAASVTGRSGVARPGASGNL